MEKKQKKEPYANMKNHTERRSYLACVIAKDGTPLMPCRNPKKVRKYLKEGKAKIYKHDPFTIQLLYESEKGVQPIELCEDTGYINAGLSIKSEKHEYVREDLTLLTDEKKQHKAQKTYRRQRRNQLRYRKPRFNNRNNKPGDSDVFIAPSLKHKAEAHVSRAAMYREVMPISSVWIETGKFDTALMSALEQGITLEGKDYQTWGLRYMMESQRIAIFTRDDYTCQICGKKLSDHPGLILVIHHIGFWKGDWSNRATNLLTVCAGCHSTKNHTKKGKLWGLKPASSLKADAAFMNTVRNHIRRLFMREFPDTPVNIVYGAMTATERKLRRLPKTHSIDAYCMGNFRPKYRAYERKLSKRRRNNRCLEKFYDAKYTDLRITAPESEERVKTGKELFSGRVRRNKNLSTENLRVFRGHKVQNGKRYIRKTRYAIRPGDVITVMGKRRIAHSVHCNGQYVQWKDRNGKTHDTATKNVMVQKHIGGWLEK